MSAIQHYLLPLGVALPSKTGEIAGGYFIWISLPLPLRAHDIAQRALDEENLTLAEGELFHVQDDPAENPPSFERCLRLCFAWEEAGKLAEGIRRLARVVERALSR